MSVLPAEVLQRVEQTANLTKALQSRMDKQPGDRKRPYDDKGNNKDNNRDNKKSDNKKGDGKKGAQQKWKKFRGTRTRGGNGKGQ